MSANQSSSILSPASEDYLIQIYLLLREQKLIVGARIADSMGVSPPAVTQALHRMARQGLITQERDEGIRLSSRGRELAEKTIRRHYLLERLLIDELDFDWVHADEEAHRLEHSLSDRLEKHIFERLGRPTTCPHGNPFPESPDEQMLLNARKLSDAREGERVTILRITEEGEAIKELLVFFYAHRLLPGTELLAGPLDEKNQQLSVQHSAGSTPVPVGYARLVRISPPQ